MSNRSFKISPEHTLSELDITQAADTDIRSELETLIAAQRALSQFSSEPPTSMDDKWEDHVVPTADLLNLDSRLAEFIGPPEYPPCLGTGNSASNPGNQQYSLDELLNDLNGAICEESDFKVLPSTPILNPAAKFAVKRKTLKTHRHQVYKKTEETRQLKFVFKRVNQDVWTMRSA